LQGVFQFSDRVAREVMTPRTDLVTVPHDSSLEEALEIVDESGFSRFPVVGEGIDDVLGILLAKDLLGVLIRRERSANEPDEFDIRRVMREPYFIPGTKPTDELLIELKLRKQHMAIVLDEHGGVDGVVTLEDLLEEIVGDIYDESDDEEEEQPSIREVEGDLLVEGGVLVSDLNAEFGLNIPQGDYDTIAGYVFSCLGRVPDVGDTVALGEEGSGGAAANGAGSRPDGGEPSEVNAPSIIVETVQGHRVELLRITSVRTEPPSDESPAPEAASENEEDVAFDIRERRVRTGS
ncbi:MAG: HlyC/CorC family transporter, partial [Bdellovibrionales bacterium]|nr:HlyC/CorC family transporter [Bdellovibrionales bacterium]